MLAAVGAGLDQNGFEAAPAYVVRSLSRVTYFACCWQTISICKRPEGAKVLIKLRKFCVCWCETLGRLNLTGQQRQCLAVLEALEVRPPWPSRIAKEFLNLEAYRFDLQVFSACRSAAQESPL